MRTFPVLVALALAACTPVSPSESTLPPTGPVGGTPSPSTASTVPSDATDVDDPEAAEAPDAPEASGDPADPTAVLEATDTTDGPSRSNDEIMAISLGMDPEGLPTPRDGAARRGGVDGAGFDTAAFGLRLVTTLPDTQPPRAILALGDGREVVVSPGDFLEAPRALVMAVGSDGVQIAHVEPHGDAVRIRPETLSALYRSDRAPMPRAVAPAPGPRPAPARPAPPEGAPAAPAPEAPTP